MGNADLSSYWSVCVALAGTGMVVGSCGCHGGGETLPLEAPWESSAALALESVLSQVQGCAGLPTPPPVSDAGG